MHLLKRRSSFQEVRILNIVFLPAGSLSGIIAVFQQAPELIPRSLDALPVKHHCNKSNT